jgi:PhnB protein
VLEPPPGYTRVAPYLLYEDADRAIEFLQAAFGFELRRTETGAAGRKHAELLLGDDGLVMVGQAGPGFKSPRALDASPPSLVHIYADRIDERYERVKAAGAEVSELETSPVGDYRFTATDPEGQVWVIAQRVAT